MGRWMQNFSLKKLKGKKHLGDLGVDGSITLKSILNKQGLYWIHLDQDRD
jgi:hypothetical protein